MIYIFPWYQKKDQKRHQKTLQIHIGRSIFGSGATHQYGLANWGDANLFKWFISASCHSLRNVADSLYILAKHSNLRPYHERASIRHTIHLSSWSSGNSFSCVGQRNKKGPRLMDQTASSMKRQIQLNVNHVARGAIPMLRGPVAVFLRITQHSASLSVPWPDPEGTFCRWGTLS
jgi:hypothetical protein